MFAKTYWAHRGGVPDLCLWKPKERLFKLVEVKGQGDTLSSMQVVWLESLLSFGIKAETFHVRIPKKPPTKAARKTATKAGRGADAGEAAGSLGTGV
nr:hypothetical protein HK105_001026 [Polyrhizophydium stewartii]